MEVDPSLYENDETKYQILKKNDGLRLEILTDVLSSHLGIVVSQQKNDKVQQFTNGYFLGRHELKNELLELLKPNMESENVLKFDKLSVKFCGKNVKPPMPEAHNFPILVHSCPEDFSTVDYFDVSLVCHLVYLYSNLFMDFKDFEHRESWTIVGVLTIADQLHGDAEEC